MTARKYDPVCSYPGCGRPHNARGLCGPHGAMQRRGEPLRPLQNRPGPLARSAVERFASHIALSDSGCIEWLGGKTLGGYGVFSATTGHSDAVRTMAHRWSYEHHKGPIPEGYDIDHLCRNRSCVNPDHLEAVTRAENIRRAFAVKDSCKRGHLLDEKNTYAPPGTARRQCRACARARDEERRDRRNAARREARRQAKRGIAA